MVTPSRKAVWELAGYGEALGTVLPGDAQLPEATVCCSGAT